MMHERMTVSRIAPVIIVLVALPVTAVAADFYLRAEAVTVNFPDGTPSGRNVVMWGFALDSSFGAADGNVTVPGPMLTVPSGDATLTIHVDNNLSVPISIVIPGQITTMTPVIHSVAPSDPASAYNGRVRSFTHETPPGNTAAVTYNWTNFRPGTFIYHSGTHPALQVQMGLYGGVKKDTASGTAYTGVPYDAEVVLFFSEVDPNFHDAVAGGNYGPGGTVTSAVNYSPQFFLINGRPNTGAVAPIPAGNPGDTVLIRFLNAGLKSHAPNSLGLRMSVVAEDGFAYRHQREHYAIGLPALKTKDAIVSPSAVGVYPIYDRALHLTNGTASPGGMVAHIETVAP